MSQESVGHWVTAGVCWWIACTHEHYSLQGYPSLVMLRAIVTILFGDLTKEGDGCLCSIVILCGQIDLITEYDKPFACLLWTGLISSVGFLGVTVLLECLQD
jgi:hypothetical protein